MPKIRQLNKAFDEIIMSPAKVVFCKCNQCKLAKKQRNRAFKKRMKRHSNKLRRTLKRSGKYYNQYWA